MKEPTVHMSEQRNPAPGMADAVVFRSKAKLLQLRRAVREFTRNDVHRFPFADALTGYPIIGETRTPLWINSDDAEQVLVAGKIHNLRLAVRRLNGVEVAAEGVFSFWKQLGRTSRFKGYVAGRELREGCLIPNTGGGLCQLSNSLYDAALRAGFLTIVGPILEGNNFWDGLHVEQIPTGEDWLRNASLVVLPAFVEHMPRRLLEAVACGVPVIASTACGLRHVRGVTTVRPGDVGSLRTEIEKVLTAGF